MHMSGVKGRTLTLPLPPCVVFCGDSFSGKTAILDAVKIGLLGYHPKFGKRPESIRPMMGGETMGVELAFDDGRKCSRTWTIKRGSMKYQVDGTVDLKAPPVLFDLNEYLSMTRGARVQFLFDRVGSESLGLTLEAVTATMKNAKVEPVTEQTEKALGVILKKSDELKSAMDDEDALLQDYITAMLLWLAEQRLATKHALDTMIGFMRGSTDLTQANGANVDDRIAAMRTSLEQVRAEITVETQRVEQVKRTAGLLSEWRLQVAELPRLEAQVKSAEALGSDLKQKIEAVPPHNFLEAQSMVSQSNDRLALKRHDLKGAKLKFETWKKDRDKKLELDHCPFCLNAEPGWQSGLSEYFLREVGTHKRAVEAAEAHAVDAEKAAAKALREFTSTEETHLRLQKLTVELDDIQSRLADEFIPDLMTAHRAKERIESVELPAPAVPVDLEALKAHEREMEVQLAGFEKQQRAFIEAQAAKKNETRALIKRAELEAQEVVIKAVHAALLSQQTALSERTVAVFAEKARRFTDGIMKAPLEVVDGDFGYRAGAVWVAHEVFSGTEEALAYSGMSVALAQESKVKIVVIDELGIMDQATRLKAVARMAELVKQGVIDQFIGADVADFQIYRDIGVEAVHITC